MAKPTNLFRWATDGGAAVEEPIEGLKDSGFPASPTPHVLVGELLNWFFNGAYQWFSWLDGFLAEAHTWTAAQAFSAGLTGTTAVLSGAISAAQVALTGSNPAAATAFSNVQTPLHLVKAQARAVFGAGANSPVDQTASDGLNCTFSTNGGGGLSVALAAPMADAKYAVVAAFETGGGTYGYTIDNKTVNGFDLTPRLSNGAAATFESMRADHGLSHAAVSFIVMGRQ